MQRILGCMQWRSLTAGQIRYTPRGAVCIQPRRLTHYKLSYVAHQCRVVCLRPARSTPPSMAFTATVVTVAGKIAMLDRPGFAIVRS